MKKVLLISLVFLIPGALRGESVNLGAFGQLSFVLDPAWKFKFENFGDTYEVQLFPKGNVNAGSVLTVVLMPEVATNTKAKLRARMIEGFDREAMDSVERRVAPKELFVKTGFGFYIDFTNAKLVGKPNARGEFKVQTVVMIRLSEQIGIIGVIKSDGFREISHLQLLSTIESMELLPSEPVAPTPKKK